MTLDERTTDEVLDFIRGAESSDLLAAMGDLVRRMGRERVSGGTESPELMIALVHRMRDVIVSAVDREDMRLAYAALDALVRAEVGYGYASTIATVREQATTEEQKQCAARISAECIRRYPEAAWFPRRNATRPRGDQPCLQLRCPAGALRRERNQ